MRTALRRSIVVRVMPTMLAFLAVGTGPGAAQEGSVVSKPVPGKEDVRTTAPSPGARALEADPQPYDQRTVDVELKDEIVRGHTFSRASSRSGGEAGLGEADLEVVPDTPPRRVGDKWTATYRLKLHNVPLSESSQVGAILLESTGTKQIRERNLPQSYSFELVDGAVPDPSVSKEAAYALARQELSRLSGDPEPDAEEAAPRSTDLEIWVDPATAVGHLAWRIDIPKSSSNGGPVRVHVSALPADGASPAVFEIRPLQHFEVRGVVKAKVFDPTPTDRPLKEHPLSSVRVVTAPVEISENEGAAEDVESGVHTDSDGSYRMASDGNPVRLIAKLANRFFIVENKAGPTVAAEAVLEGNEIDIRFGGESEFEVAQPSAFYWANQARAFVGSVLQDDQLLGVRLATNVNGECNATFSSLDNRINLFRASPPGSSKTCINKAYLDTVFHEYGHAIDFALGGISNEPDGLAYSEGFGDSLAILFKEDSCYGRNHESSGSCLRDAASPPVMFDSPGGTHQRGRIYAGFTWELLKALKASQPSTARATALSLTLQTAVLSPRNIAGAVELVLVVDDDDLDLSNGTPHASAIVQAAKSRAIPLPDELPRELTEAAP